MLQQSSLGGTNPAPTGLGDSKYDRRMGGLGVWFETKGEDYVKGTETDFVITTALPNPPSPSSATSLRPNISKLLYATTTDTLRDLSQEKGGFPIRTGLVRKHGKIKMLTTYRDAHVYLFPHWVLEFVKRNMDFDSISEDVVGWWAKASWQDGLPEKLHMDQAVRPGHQRQFSNAKATNVSENIDLQTLSSTFVRNLSPSTPAKGRHYSPPAMLSYIQPYPSDHLIRRVDTSALLLSTCLRLAALTPLVGALPEAKPTPLSHSSKIATDPSLIASHTTIHTPTTLIAPNTSIATHCTIQRSCIGANCVISEGAKILGSLLMDNVQVGSKASLQGCILGRRCVIGKGAKLEGCEVQDGFCVEDGTVGSKGEKFCVFEGLENGLDELGEEDEAVN